MKTIKINEDVLNLVPEELKNLPDVSYKLLKTESFRSGFVDTGHTVTGTVMIVNVVGKPGVMVLNDSYGGGDLETSYIRTSPVVEVLDRTDTTLTFKTEGGVYTLTRAENENS